MKISIRNAEKNDIEGIMLIEYESFHRNITESRDAFLDRINVFSDGFLILEIDGDVAGYISSEMWDFSEIIDMERFNLNHSIRDVHKPSGSQLYISSIGILKNHHGKGYGNMLYSELEKRITGKYSIISMILIVSENWNAARKLYENNGFKEISRISSFFDDENNSDAIVMRKHISKMAFE